MPSFAVHQTTEYYDLGVSSEKPALGRGKGKNASDYIEFHRQNGFAGFARVSFDCLIQTFAAFRDSGYRLEGANLLHINPTREEPNEHRHMYIFFKRQSDAFMWKTLMMDNVYGFLLKDKIEGVRKKRIKAKLEPVIEIW